MTTTPGPAPTAPAAQPAPAPATPSAEPTPQPSEAPPPTASEPPPPAQTEYAPTVTAPPPPPDEPEPKAPRGPFSRGAIRLTLLVGTASTHNDNYFIIGGGLGYYVLDGLELGLDYEAWLFAKPVIQRLSPEIRYVFHMVPVIKPYVGTFYRRNFVTDYDDYNQLGGRIGAFYMPKGGRMYFGAGAVYDRVLDCTWQDCDEWYPEIAIGVSL
ncbi:MAG TPA: hypothetical protein VFK05_33790 [Polyangiaceae bacterium]|nr:hypothetical protein [Polyangiaceae bacterium]